MATLVLSTAGTMLGGPVGGAIGSLLGQSIDQQLLGPGPRRGPKLGDLSIQSSTYGAPIPKLFGRMRVAGSIIWSTDLQESASTEAAKGAPETVTYSYSASFAVALSSRPIGGIGRIWADGKLIRSAEGLFTVATSFRLYDGSEQQQPDPLIASIEGMDTTPAYRGLAYAVFEHLELAEFGNRIPFLTFEVIADAEPVALGALLGEISGGVIESSAPARVAGYAAYGPSAKTAVEGIVSAFGVQLVDDGVVLRSPSDSGLSIVADESGCGTDGRTAGRKQRSQVPATSLPTAVAITYYDTGRDYQTGRVRASVENGAGSLEQIELPAALDASTAKAIAETSLSRRWAERDMLTLRLPPHFLDARPGALVQIDGSEQYWRIQRVKLDGLVTEIDLRPVYATIDALPADEGRALPSPQIALSPTELAILELPDDGSGAAEAPVIAVAAAGSVPWRAVPLQAIVNGTSISVQSPRLPSIMGAALSDLGSGQSSLLDLRNHVDVQLHDPDQWLESRDDDSLCAGANLAILGDELLQFGEALPLAEGVFRLSRLLRGRRGSEWAMDSHRAGERFVLLDRSRLVFLPVERASAGGLVKVIPHGLADDGLASVERTIRGDALRPPAPVHLRAYRDEAGDLVCSWTRRSNAGWDWLDGVDAPLGCSVERYRVTLAGDATTLALETDVPEARIPAAQLPSGGSGSLQLAVEQIGDFAISRAATLSITTA